MTGLANFHLHPRGETGGNPQAGPENPQNERITVSDQFHPPTHADAQRFEAQDFLIIRPNRAHHRADPGREFIEPDQAGGRVCTNHSIKK
jgi:hypothetical protein